MFACFFRRGFQANSLYEESDGLHLEHNYGTRAHKPFVGWLLGCDSIVAFQLDPLFGKVSEETVGE